MTWQWPIIILALGAFFLIAAGKGIKAATQATCPHCRSRISRHATVCPACARDIPTAAPLPK